MGATQTTDEPLDVDTMLAAFSDEVLEILAPAIENTTILNAMQILEHELQILHHLVHNCTFLTNNITQNILGNFEIDGIVSRKMKTFVCVIARQITTSIQNKMKINQRKCHICNKNCTSRCISCVDYIVKSLENEPKNIAQAYYFQQFLFQDFDSVMAAVYQESAQKLATTAQNLRDTYSLRRWCCYFCGNMNGKTDTINNNNNNNICNNNYDPDVCQCQVGLNPLYFSNKNQSKDFIVDPTKFGLLRVRCMCICAYVHFCVFVLLTDCVVLALNFVLQLLFCNVLFYLVT